MNGRPGRTSTTSLVNAPTQDALRCLVTYSTTLGTGSRACDYILYSKKNGNTATNVDQEEKKKTMNVRNWKLLYAWKNIHEKLHSSVWIYISSSFYSLPAMLEQEKEKKKHSKNTFRHLQIRLWELEKSFKKWILNQNDSYRNSGLKKPPAIA